MTRPIAASQAAPSPRRAKQAASPSARTGTMVSLGAIVLLAAWAGAATLYVLFNDEALKLLMERQVSITRAYENQIALQQAEIDRLRSLKLVDQERVDRAINDLARRQKLVEARETQLGELQAARPSAGPLGRAVPEPVAAPANRPRPLSDTILLSPRADDLARLESRPLPPGPSPVAQSGQALPAEQRLHELAAQLQRTEILQSERLSSLEVALDSRTTRMQKVIDEIGGRAQRVARSAPATAGMGGPFLPWARPTEEPFSRQLTRVRAAAEEVRSLESVLNTLPIRRPVDASASVTSSFGVRLDPFLRQPALHTGVDFRGEPGDPVYATAAGLVAQAERNGGYGLLVEIDHGNGIVTRYAHLSALEVEAGARVRPGDLIGRVGSTGRSTGPHLHYEVRIDGDATDPQRFLRAGLRLDQ